MLKQISRLEKTRNYVLLGFVVMMAASLIFFYAPRRTEQTQNLTRSQETIASVGGETISVGELATAQENAAKQYAQFGSQFKPPAKTLLNGEISSRLIRLEAARLNLTPTDEETAVYIRNILKQQGMDTKDVEKYRQLVTENAGSVEKFEQSVRDELAEKKVQAFLTSGVQVSDDEIVDQFKREQTSFDLVYVPVTTQSVALTLKPSDDELRRFFDGNKAPYYISTEQKKIRYLFINQAKVGDKLDIPEADLRAEYDALPADKKQAGVEVQQIVIKSGDDKQDVAALAKATELTQKARQDAGKISEQAFGDLARGNSQDTATASGGGKIKGLVRPNPNNTDDPLQKVLTLEVGQVTDPIKYAGKYYILRRGDAKPKSFEDAKQELLVSLRNRRAYKASADLANKAAARLKETNDVAKTAQEFAAPANMNTAEMTRETKYIAPGDDVENIGTSPQFEDAITPLESNGQIGEVTPIKDGFAIPVLVDKKPARDADFDDVKERVAAAYKLDQAKSRLEQTAKDLAANSNSADALKASAAKIGLKASDSKAYKIGTPLGEAAAAVPSTPQLDEAIYNLKSGEVTKTPVKSGDNYYVIAAVKRTDADLNEFAKNKDQRATTALTAKKNQVFGDYLSDLRRRLESQGRIKIYQDALAKLDPKKSGEDS